MLLRLASILALASLVGCAASDCPSGFIRVGSMCVAVGDGGVGIDSGVRSDGGADAARVDAGRDSGVDAPVEPVDAGLDVGSDAGSDAGNDAGTDAHVPCSGICPPPSPYCVDETCVGCRDSADCSGATPFCDATSHACVACLASTDCPATASVCASATHTCTPCTMNADCAHVAGRGICTGGACVQCSVRDESPCSGHSCDPATGACTSTPTSSVAGYGACVADSECHFPQRCVPVFFGGVRRPGGFCLGLSTSSCTGCGVMVTEPRESLSGQTAATYCSVDEMYATFEGHRDGMLSTTCTEDSDCGAVGLDDGRCVVGNRCFTGCAATCECPGGFGYTCRTDHFCG